MILVTGSTGTFGSSVLKKLQERKIASKAVNFKNNFIWSDPKTFDVALEGIEKVFLISPSNDANFDKEIVPFLDKAKKAGVKFVLLITVYGTEKNPESTFGKAEKVVVESGINYAVLRPNFIFQNFINFDIQAVKSGSIYLPTGNSKTSYIDVNDVANACATILANPEKHSGKSYTLTGSESLSHEQFAEIFTSVLGKKITNIAPSNEEYKAALLSYHVPQLVVDFMAYLYAAIEAGYFTEVTNHYELITGQKPMTAREFIEQNRLLFLD